MRVERDSALKQITVMTQERERLEAECAGVRAAAMETEHQLRTEIEQLTATLPDPAFEPAEVETANGLPLPQRYLELAEQVRSLRAQVEDGAVGKSSGKGGGGSGWLGRVFGGGGEAVAENPLGRRLDTLRTEALAEREKLLYAEAEAARADLETQLAETRAQLQEAQARAERLEMEMIQNQSSGRRYQPGARYDAAHDAAFGGPTPATGTPANSQWRLDELT